MSIRINFSEFIIKEKLGEGNFGKVYKVYNKDNDQYYALKEFLIKDENEEKINKIQKEAEILSKFNSNNIVEYYDSFRDNEKFYILMEYCEKGHLKNFINKRNSVLIEEKIISKIIKQICLGIKEIHDNNIIHRDLKTENIFLKENYKIKIGDFGISRQLDSFKNTLTKSIGTLYYIAPEIIIGNDYNKKADIFSLGCIIYELFNLSTYFEDKIRDNIKTINEDDYSPK